MARKSYSVELINSYIIDNLTPYAWSNLWETTESDKRGLFYFLMIVRPNDYERKHSLHQQTHLCPSSNSLDFPDTDYFQIFGVKIPMITGDAITKRGKTLDDDARSKYDYRQHLAKLTFEALQEIEPNDSLNITAATEIYGFDRKKVDGATGFERVDAYEAGMPKHIWSLVRRDHEKHSNK